MLSSSMTTTQECTARGEQTSSEPSLTTGSAFCVTGPNAPGSWSVFGTTMSDVKDLAGCNIYFFSKCVKLSARSYFSNLSFSSSVLEIYPTNITIRSEKYQTQASGVRSGVLYMKVL